jgi:hypothetical protein
MVPLTFNGNVSNGNTIDRVEVKITYFNNKKFKKFWLGQDQGVG